MFCTRDMEFTRPDILLGKEIYAIWNHNWTQLWPGNSVCDLEIFKATTFSQ